MRKIAEFLTGFDAVILGMIIFVGYRYFEVQSLFYRYLPLADTTRLIASCLVAIVVVFSLLVFSSHIDRFKLSKQDDGAWIKWMMFVFTLFINGFFWKIWKADSGIISGLAWLVICFKIIISVFFALFDYAYNHLFISKWHASEKEKSLSQGLAILQSKINQLKQEESEIQQDISKSSANLKAIIARQDPKVCPRCGKSFSHANQRNGHLRTCKVPILEIPEYSDEESDLPVNKHLNQENILIN